MTRRTPTPNRDRAIQQLALLRPTAGYRDGDTLRLNLCGEIGETNRSGEGIYAIAVEAVLARHRSAHRIECRINSPGGYVREAEKIYSLLRSDGRFVRTIAGNTCASAAVLILAAGNFRQAKPTSRLLLHRAAISAGTGRWTADRHKASARALDDCDRKIVALLTERTRATPEQIRAEISSESPMSIAMARRWGLIDCLEGEELLMGGNYYAFPPDTPRAVAKMLAPRLADMQAMMRGKRPADLRGIGTMMGHVVESRTCRDAIIVSTNRGAGLPSSVRVARARDG